MGIMNVLGLMQETRDVVKSLGHEVNQWNVISNTNYSLVCKDCNMQVAVNEITKDNIQIQGDAMSKNCVKPEKKKLSKKK
jgi:hypothetical protein